MELWEIGGLIGANHPPEPEKSGTQRAGGAAAPSGPNAWNVQRILAMERGEPEPSFDDNPHARSEHWSLIDQARMAGADV